MNKVAEIEIRYNAAQKAQDRPKISNSRDAADIARQLYDPGKIELMETAYVLILDRMNRVKGSYKLSEGATNAALIDPKMVFSVALKAAAAAVVMVHNHPSGGVKPSEADVTVTKVLRKGGGILDIPVLDHIILSPYDGVYYSFADEGLID